MPDLSLNSPEWSAPEADETDAFNQRAQCRYAWTIRLIVLDISHRSPAPALLALRGECFCRHPPKLPCA
jgi:hypothetical protein